MNACSRPVFPAWILEDVMAVLEPEHIETLKTELMQGHLTRKILRKYRSLGLSYLVVIDGPHMCAWIF